MASRERNRATDHFCVGWEATWGFKPTHFEHTCRGERAIQIHMWSAAGGIKFQKLDHLILMSTLRPQDVSRRGLALTYRANTAGETANVKWSSCQSREPEENTDIEHTLNTGGMICPSPCGTSSDPFSSPFSFSPPVCFFSRPLQGPSPELLSFPFIF